MAGAAAGGDRARAGDAPRLGLAAVTGAVVAGACAVAAPGAFAFLAFQRERGTEIESLGALVFHGARQFGWEGRVELHYGSLEFLGPYVPVVSTLALGLSVMAFGWLLLWRVRAREFSAHTPADAAFTAVLLFTTTSRVISPQYLVWLVGLAAVCLVFRAAGWCCPPVWCWWRPVSPCWSSRSGSGMWWPVTRRA